MKVENSNHPVSLLLKVEELLENKHAHDGSPFDHVSEDQSPASAYHTLPGNSSGWLAENETLHGQQKPDIEHTAFSFATIELLPSAFFILLQNGTISRLNARGAKMLHKDPSELLGKDLKLFLDREGKKIFSVFLKQLFKTRTKQNCQLKLSVGLKEAIDLFLEGILSGDAQQCLVTAIDVTEQAKKEEALKQAQANLFSLINNRDESIWSINNNYQLLTCNNIFRDECFAAFNIELKKGMNILHVFPSELSHLWKHKYTRAMTGRKVVFEYSKQVGNELHDYEVFLNPIVADKKVTGVTAISVVVTWRKQAEEALKRSEERHRLLADNASDVISTLDVKGRLTYVSPSVKKLTGYNSSEMMNFRMEEIYTIESAAIFHSNLEKLVDAVKNGFPTGEFRDELELWCKSGFKKWVEVTTTVMHNHLGEFVGILCVTRDISTRKMAELALRRSETKYRSLYESIIDGFASIDLQGKIIDCNIPFEQMVGYNKQELVQLNFSEIIPEKWHAYGQCIKDEQIIPKGFSQVYEEEFIRKDGTIFPVELRVFAVKDEPGNIERLCAIVRDITEQKIVKEALTKSEKLYHALFEESNAVMFLIDPANGAIVDANAAASRYYGYSREKFSLLNISDINMLPPSQVQSSLAEVVQRKKLRYHFQHKLADSNIREVEIFACPIEIEGRVLVHSIIYDITDRKIAEEALIASEARFRNLLQNVSAVAVQGYSPDGIIQYWNHASELLYGYSAQEAIGRNIAKLIVAPEKQEELILAIHRMVETGLPETSTEMSLLRRNGSRVEVHASHAIVQIPGRAPELFCFEIDLTKRKQAEEKVRERDEIFDYFLENSPIYIFFKDEHLRYLQLSRNYEEILGMKIEELIGKSAKDILPVSLAESITENERNVIKEDLKYEGEYEMNGRSYSTIKFPIKIKGKATQIAGFTIDITEQKKAEKAIKESETSLRELIATKDKFFSIIAHDLRGPFNSIMGFSDLLIRQIQESDHEGIDRYATIIHSSSQRVMNLLVNLLEWSRSQTGTLEFKPERTSINALIRETAELLNEAALQKSIIIYLELSSDIFVYVDRHMVSTILRNLISNSIKFTHDQGEIVISAWSFGHECLVRVEDNGIGIKMESIEKLFRIDASNSTLGTHDEMGTGLGLILCKDFIDKHKGKIWVESERGSKEKRGWTKFYFTVPLA